MPVIFVLASDYSGSHLLARLLGAHERCADIGELARLRKFLARPGGNRAGTEAAYATSALFAELPRRPESEWHGLLRERLAAHGEPVEVLVDNSKRVSWTRRLVAAGAVEARCVHLLRDPRALARRWRDNFRSEGTARRVRLREAGRDWRRAPAILAGPEMAVYARRWLRENAAIDAFLAEAAPSAPRLAYEELLARPRQTLAELMPRLGLAFDPGQLDARRGRSLGTRKTAWEGVVLGAPDERWLAETTADERAAVEGVAPLRAQLAGFGFEMGARGLVRCARPADHEAAAEVRP